MKSPAAVPPQVLSVNAAPSAGETPPSIYSNFFTGSPLTPEHFARAQDTIKAQAGTPRRLPLVMVPPDHTEQERLATWDEVLP